MGHELPRLPRTRGGERNGGATRDPRACCGTSGSRRARQPGARDGAATTRGARRARAIQDTGQRRGGHHRGGTRRPRQRRTGEGRTTTNRATARGGPSRPRRRRAGGADTRGGGSKQTPGGAGSNYGSAPRTRRVRRARATESTNARGKGGGGRALRASGILGHTHGGTTGGDPHQPDLAPLRTTQRNGTTGASTRDRQRHRRRHGTQGEAQHRHGGHETSRGRRTRHRATLRHPVRVRGGRQQRRRGGMGGERDRRTSGGLGGMGRHHGLRRGAAARHGQSGGGTVRHRTYACTTHTGRSHPPHVRLPSGPRNDRGIVAERTSGRRRPSVRKDGGTADRSDRATQTTHHEPQGG